MNNKVSFIVPTVIRLFDALFLGWVAGYGILVVGWTNIQPREGSL